MRARHEPASVDRLGVALEPHESYEVSPGEGGGEDPHVVYVPLLERYVMTYTAFVPYEPRVAVAISAPGGHPHYCMGVAVLDGERPSRVLYRTPLRVLKPQTEYEDNGLVDEVVFPSATDLRADGALDVYYGAADHVIAAARLSLPSKFPVVTVTPNGG